MNYYFYVLMTVFVTVNHLDYTELRYWLGIPQNLGENLDALNGQIKLPIAEIKSQIWENMLCAMADTYISVDNKSHKLFDADNKIYSARVEVQMECMTHKGEFYSELLPENSQFESWSPELHNIIETTAAELSDDIIAMIVGIAEAYHSNSDGGGDPRYGIQRNNKTNRTCDFLRH